MEDFESDYAVVLAILGQIYRGHPAATKLAVDDVGVRESRTQPIDWQGQVRIPESEGQGLEPIAGAVLR